VRDDLYMNVLRAFHDAGIRIPVPVHEARVPGVVLEKDR